MAGTEKASEETAGERKERKPCQVKLSVIGGHQHENFRKQSGIFFFALRITVI